MSRIINMLAVLAASFQKMPMFYNITNNPHGRSRGGRPLGTIPAPQPRKVRRMGQRYRSSRKFSCVRTIISVSTERVVCRTIGGSIENWRASRFFAVNSVCV